MLEIYCFDIGACLVLVTMLATIFFRKMTKDRRSSIFVQLVSVTLVAGVFDILTNAMNGATAIPEVIKYVSNSCYYVCRAIGYFLYARYIIDLSGTRHIFKKRWYRFLARPPVMIAFALSIITYFNHMCYFYSEKGYYIRGKWNIIFYLICGGYALFATCATIKNRKFFGTARSISLISVAIFSVVTAAVQYLYPYVVIDVLGFAMSILFVMLFISNPSDATDFVSGLKNYKAYMDDMKRSFEIEKPVAIIFVNVVNMPALEELISFDNFLILAKLIAGKIETISSRYKADADLYYLRNGRYRAVMLSDRLKGSRFEEFTEELLRELSAEIKVNETSVYIETNVCVAYYPGDFSTSEELMNFGGLLEKEEKKDYVMYASVLLETTEYDMITKLDAIMERAILSQGFDIYYQPIYSTNEKCFTHAEALLRLIDKEFGFIMPESIIAAAETNGTIHRIGKIVLEEVCRFISSDQYKTLGLTAIAVNVSLIQLMQKNFAQDFISTLKSYGISADQIILEITESEVTENQKTVVDNIDEIAKFGTKFSLNNYGAGYSNITTTSTLPLASSKLDRTLINSKSNERLEILIENSVILLKSLGRTVVVVGVENEDDLKKFEKLHVDYIQGFYFSKPLQKRDFVYYIEHHKDVT